jgi:hypothetical protein
LNKILSSVFNPFARIDVPTFFRRGERRRNLIKAWNRRLRVEREGNAALSGGASTIEQTWPKERTGQTEVKALDRRAVIEALQAKLRQLPPQNDAQPWLQSRGRIKKPAP